MTQRVLRDYASKSSEHVLEIINNVRFKFFSLYLFLYLTVYWICYRLQEYTRYVPWNLTKVCSTVDVHRTEGSKNFFVNNFFSSAFPTSKPERLSISSVDIHHSRRKSASFREIDLTKVILQCFYRCSRK